MPDSHGNDPNRADPAVLPLLLTFLALYLGAVVALAWRIGGRPDFLYNWEPYTARGLIDFAIHPTWDILKMNQGLMTDSGESAIVVGPAWLGFKVFGHTFLGMRLPIVLVSALAVPMTWLFGRKLFSDPVGLAGALLVLSSQAFLLYGRTATVVGLSLGIALAGYLLLWMCVRRSDEHWVWWLAAFQAALIVNSYFYSPIRILWPIACVVLAAELVLRSGQRTRFALSLVTTLVVLPLAVTLLRPGPLSTPVSAVEWYFNGRGEQLFQMRKSPTPISNYIRVDSEEERQRIAEQSTNAQSWRLIRQNSKNLGNLLIDRHTRPAITDFWNPTGRLYPKVLVPFLIAGLILLLVRCFRDPRARLLLALFWGFSLPMILTTQVHIGRLIYIVPLIGIICALPVGLIARWLARRQPASTRSAMARWAGLGVAALVVIAGATPSLADWQTSFPPPRMTRVADLIVERTYDSPAPQLVYVFGDAGAYEIEALRIAELEMLLPGYLRFEDLTTGDMRGNGAISLMYGAVLTKVNQPDLIPGFCTNLYLVEPNVLDQFHAASDPVATAACGKPLSSESLHV